MDRRDSIIKRRIEIKGKKIQMFTNILLLKCGVLDGFIIIRLGIPFAGEA